MSIHMLGELPCHVLVYFAVSDSIFRRKKKGSGNAGVSTVVSSVNWTKSRRLLELLIDMHCQISIISFRVLLPSGAFTYFGTCLTILLVFTKMQCWHKLLLFVPFSANPYLFLTNYILKWLYFYMHLYFLLNENSAFFSLFILQKSFVQWQNPLPLVKRVHCFIGVMESAENPHVRHSNCKRKLMVSL